MSPAIDYGRVADLYDALVRFEADIPFFLEECRQIEGRVLELMSGTGRVSIPLLESDVQLTCVDSSSAMLEVLRAKLADRGLTAQVLEQDVTSLQLGNVYELAFLAFHSFAELVERRDRRFALAGIHAALTPGGRFVCTLHNPSVRLRSLSEEPTIVARGTVADDELTLELDVRYDPESGIVEGLEIFRRTSPAGAIVRQERLPIRFALIQEPELRELAQVTGFEIEAVYGDYDRSSFDECSSPYMIWVLRRWE